MAFSQQEIDFFSKTLGQPLDPSIVNSNKFINPTILTLQGMSDESVKPTPPQELSQYYKQDPNNGWITIDPKTGKQITILQDPGYVLDRTNVQYDPNIGIYTDPTNIRYEGDGLDWLPFAMLAPAFLGATGMLGGAGGTAGATGGLDAAGWGGFVEGAGGAVGAGMSEQAAMLAAQEAGFSASEIAAWQAGTGGSSITSFLASPAGKTALKGAASVITSGLGGGGGSGGSNWGNVITGGANLAYQDSLGKQAVDDAKQLASGLKFTPYNISSGMGRTYVDPATGEMKSELSPEYQAMQNTLGDSFYGNMQYATMDPMQASQYAYNMGSNLTAYQDEQNRLGLEDRLLAQGMLGSTGGGHQMRALYDSMNQRDLGREAQSLGLGQDMLTQYQNRGLAAYQPMLNTQSQFGNQINQSGQLGGQALTGQKYGADMINNANLGRMKMQSTAATGFANNPAVSGGINNLVNGISNWDWTGGNYSVPDAAYSWQQTPPDSSSFWGNGDYSNVDWTGFGG